MGALVATLGRCVLAQRAAEPSEDYSTARKQFQTHLTRHIPAPETGQALRPPTGAQQIEYEARLHLKAWITPQRGEKTGAKRPAVLFLHGHLSLNASYWKLAQPYRDAGYIVMLPALRGENGQPGDYSMFYNEVDDVLAAANYLARRPDVDPTHLYLAGHSVGGTLTLLASQGSSLFRAAASFSGAPDVRAWSESRKELRVFASNSREFAMRSPLAFAESFRCPVRLYCGDQEPFFLTYSSRTAARAQKKGLDAATIPVPGNHFSAVPEEVRQSIRFFQSH